jgi:hypothetical protein
MCRRSMSSILMVIYADQSSFMVSMLSRAATSRDHPLRIRYQPGDRRPRYEQKLSEGLTALLLSDSRASLI